MVIVIILTLLIVPYLVLTATDRLSDKISIGSGLGGRISLAMVFLFTGLGHFIQTEPMARI